MKGPCELCGVEFRSSWAKVCAACKTGIDASTLDGAILQIYCWADDDDSGALAEAARLLRPFLPVRQALESRAEKDHP